MKNAYKKITDDIKAKAAEIRFTEPDKVIEYLKTLREIAVESEDDYNEAYAELYTGDAYITLGRLDKAYKSFIKAYTIIGNTRFHELIIQWYNFMAIYYSYSGNRAMALECFVKGLGFAVKNDDYFMQSRFYNNIGTLYLGVEDYTKAMEYFGRAYRMKLGQQTGGGYSQEQLRYHMNMALCCCKNGDIKEAAAHDAIIQNNLNDFSIRQHGKGIKAVSAMIAHQLGNDSKAEQIIDELNSLENEQYGSVENFSAYLDIAFLCTDMGLYEKGVEMLSKLENEAENDPLRIRCIYEAYIKLYEKSGIEKLSGYYEKFYDISQETMEKDFEKKRTVVSGRLEIFEEDVKRKKYVEQNSELEVLSERDPLTGAYNRYAFRMFSEKALKNSVKENRNLSVIEMDIDYFKKYNDTYGHPAGDECLKQVTAIINKVSGDKFTLFRHGGDEFFILGEDVSAEEVNNAAAGICDSIRAAGIEFSHNPAGVVTVSLGAVLCRPRMGESMSELIHYADVALYERKKAGRGGFVFHARC